MNPSAGNDRPLEVVLFLLRLSVFLVMFIWTVDKFVNPGHAAAVYEKFYFIGGLSTSVVYLIGAAELLFLAGFLLGLARTITYGGVLAFHGVSTLSAWAQYLDPFAGSNLLFFAAWPMLAACVALFVLRDRDRFAVTGAST